MKLGAPKPMFFYRTCMATNALGNAARTKKHLEGALELNAGFDIRQAAKALQTPDRMDFK
jgi:hypothetical protein